MEISAHILPRRVILAALVLLGLGLRMWGLGWGGLEAGAGQHPDEWTWQVIEALSWSNPTYPGIWTQSFYSLAALLRGIISIPVGWLGVVVGEVRNASELALPARFAGRLAVALLGTMQIWVAYMLARRCFDSVATGLLAAAVVAANPLLVAHAHYLALDVPLGLAVMLCLWAAWRMADHPRAWVMAVAGLSLGLCVTTRASGILVAPAFPAAFFLAWRRARPELRQGSLIWPASFLGGLLAGLLLGYPGFLLHLPEVGDILTGSLAPSSHPGAGWWETLAERGRGAWTALGGAAGWELVLLWLAGLAHLLWRRHWLALLLAFFPPLYLLASLTTLTGSVEGQQAVWLPVASMLACWPLVALCRRLPGRWWPAMGALALGILLCAWPAWRSLGVSFLFWQQDTIHSARFWATANLPREARLLVGPRAPLGLHPGSQPWPAQDSAAQVLEQGDYFAVASLGEDGDPAQWPAKSPGAAVLKELRSRLQLIKAFDLHAGWCAGGAGFPRWLSPRIEILANLPARQPRQALALYKPWVGAERAYAVIYGDQPSLGRDENALWLAERGQARRVLRLQERPPVLRLELRNLGQDLGLVDVAQGSWKSRQVRVYPGQQVNLDLQAANWPPMAAGFYPVSLNLRRGGGLLARLDWDPLVMGRRALEQGQYALAAQLLEKAAASHSQGLEARVLLAGAYARLGRFAEAAQALQALSAENAKPLNSYLALAGQAGPQVAWEEGLSHLTGTHPQLLRQATSLAYDVRGPQCLSQGVEIPLRGEGYQGAFLRQAGQGGGFLKLWLAEPWPEGKMQAQAHLWLREPAGAGEELAQMEIWAHDWSGAELLARRPVRKSDLLGGAGSLPLNFEQVRQGAKLEFRLVYTSGADLRLDRLSLGLDLRGHLNSILRWYHEARGRVALSQGRHAEAVAAFQALLALEPKSQDILLPLAQALVDAGRLRESYQMVQQAEELFFSQPERLSQVRDIYRLLQREPDVARVEQRLQELHPSLKREARLANGLMLLGFDLSRGEARRGGDLEVSYYWQVWSPPPLDYYIFVHLKGPDRLLIYDHLLDHGRRPMPSLVTGQVVREKYQIAIPADAPPGRYRLVVGMWDPRFTRQRVGVLAGEGQGGDEVTLATLEVR